MATTAQTFANRENSKLSTGPRTPEGKAASSANATIHGFCAADPVLPHEDRNQFNQLLESYNSDWAPRTAHEQFLVEQMAGSRWKLARLERLENTILFPLADPGDPTASDALLAQAMTGKDTGAVFAKFERYRAALERTYHRCAREMRATQDAQTAKKQNEAKLAQLTQKKFDMQFKEFLDAEMARGDQLVKEAAERIRMARNAQNNAATPGK